jgi:hypothetical protein
MFLEDLFQFVLNIEKAAINPGKDAEGNPWNSKEQKTKTLIPRNQGVKGKNHKKGGIKSSIFKDQDFASCDFCGRKGQTETACRIKQKQWPLLKRTLRTELISGKRKKLKKLNPLLQQLQLLNKKIVLVKKMRMTRTKRLS